MNYRPEIDGLRGVAVLAVILYHAGYQPLSGGFVGVDVFFVISGYLITTILLTERQNGTFSLAGFYERRARRILPMLLMVMLLSLPFAWLWMTPRDLKSFAQSLIAVSLFSSNILFWKTSGYFDAASDAKPLLHTWSLAVEEQYYLLFPVLLLLTQRLSRRATAIVLGAIAAASLAWTKWECANDPEAAFYLLPSRGWEILTGSLLACYMLHKGKPIGANIRQCASLLGFALIAYAAFMFNRGTPFLSLHLLIPTLGTACILLFAAGDTWLGALLGSEALVRLGTISYSAYLWHQPLLAFARLRSIDGPGPFLVLTLAALAFGLAYASWKFVELPFRDKRRVSTKTIVGMAAMAGALIISAGCIGYARDGFANRFSPEQLRFIAAEPSGPDRCELTTEDIFKGKACLIGNQQAPPALALIGDSHAGQLVEALSQRLAQKGASALVLWHSWCVPLIDVGTDDPLKNPQCRGFVSSAYTFIQRRPNIRTVILAAEWPNYAIGQRWNDSGMTFYTDGQSAKKDAAENVATFRRGMERTAKILARSGKHAIVVGSVPEYEVEVPRYLAQQVRRGFPARLGADKRITRESYQRRNREVTSIFQDLGLSTWATLVDPFEIFCGSGDCDYLDSAGDSLYRDSNHLSIEGARRLVDALLNRIK